MAQRKNVLSPELLLATVSAKAAEDKNNPMLEYQVAIGEIIKNENLREPIRLEATALLSDVVCRKPAEANGEAVRRLAKFFIHGTSEAFKVYNPEPTMRTAFNALTGFISEGGVIGQGEDETAAMDDQVSILDRVLETAPLYNVSATNMEALQKNMVPA